MIPPIRGVPYATNRSDEWNHNQRSHCPIASYTHSMLVMVINVGDYFYYLKRMYVAVFFYFNPVLHQPCGSQKMSSSNIGLVNDSRFYLRKFP